MTVLVEMVHMAKQGLIKNQSKCNLFISGLPCHAIIINTLPLKIEYLIKETYFNLNFVALVII